MARPWPLALAVATLLAGCGGAAAQPSREAPHRLVIVGDSLTAGRFADTQDDAFPQRVAAALHARLASVGVPGATSAQLAARAVPGRGDVVVLEAGTNDFL